jgi:hypothetical protein
MELSFFGKLIPRPIEMSNKVELTLQTAASFERIYDALMGETTDDLSSIILHLRELLRKAKEIEEISAEINHIDGF